MNEWVRNQIFQAEQLVGRRLGSFSGVEMAIREDDGFGKPEFFDDSVPCLQFARLYLHFEDRGLVQVSTYQDDDEFGLCLVNETDALDSSGWEGIFRFRQVHELVGGPLNRAATSLSDRGNLSELTLSFGTHEIRILAGEIYEESGRSLSFCRDDESVLVFKDPADVARIPWRG